MDDKHDALAAFGANGKKKDTKGKEPKSKDIKGKGKEVEEEEEGDIEDKEVQAIYARASRNDMDLPEQDPPSSFKLDLRPYQKQALGWMVKMEGGEEDARQSLSLHPLYEEYRFPSPIDGPVPVEPEPFFYSPYSGELTLKFPKASKKCRGGILADGKSLPSFVYIADA